MISAVLKRNGRLVSFNRLKIDAAILKAFDAVGEDTSPVSELAEKVAVKLEERGGTLGVEEIQDVVEHVLIDAGFADVAKAYILYREKRSEIRRAKMFFGVRDELKLSVNAAKVLEKRYLLKDDRGSVTESPSQMFFRVAEAVDSNRGHASEFYEVMKNLQFLPNSPTLMNAGAPLGQLSACFALPVNDSLESIFTAVKQMSIIQQSGGGTGFSFSHLRPRGDIVRSTHGVASGPVSFIRVFDTATDVIKQGGKRRGANMAVMHVSHPDIIEFITAKAKGVFTNFNFSVAVDDAFMKALEHGEEYALINPRNRRMVRSVDAGSLWNLIAEKAWECGDPGLIFIDEINRYNPTPELGEIESTNPCAEQPLLPYESCNLGSINLSKLVRNEEINWDLLSELVTTGIIFLDFVIDVNRFPLKRIAKVTRGNRKIGLGVMGFADMLVQLHIPYDSSEALKLAEQIMKHISRIAGETSMDLAEKYGDYPNIDRSMHRVRRRNATLTTIAPTGSLSIIANCSSGIEPIFAISFVRN
ncbi:MAG: ribonucleoside-diphosphate reductase alpha chain, partial [Desulfobacteraceae bacterium Eth-SRB1]